MACNFLLWPLDQWSRSFTKNILSQNGLSWNFPEKVFRQNFFNQKFIELGFHFHWPLNKIIFDFNIKRPMQKALPAAINWEIVECTAVGLMPAFTKFETWVAKRNGKCFKGRFAAISDDSVNHFYRFGRNFFNFAMSQSRWSLYTRFANCFRAKDSDRRWWSGPWLRAPWNSSPNSGLQIQTTCEW